MNEGRKRHTHSCYSGPAFRAEGSCPGADRALISLAWLPSRCAACIRPLSVPSYFGPIHDLMWLLSFLNIFFFAHLFPQEPTAMSVSCDGNHERVSHLGFSFLSSIAAFPLKILKFWMQKYCHLVNSDQW